MDELSPFYGVYGNRSVRFRSRMNYGREASQFGDSFKHVQIIYDGLPKKKAVTINPWNTHPSKDLFPIGRQVVDSRYKGHGEVTAVTDEDVTIALANGKRITYKFNMPGIRYLFLS